MPQLRRLEQPRRDARPRTVEVGQVRPGRSRLAARSPGTTSWRHWPGSATPTCPGSAWACDELDRVLGGGLVPGSVVLVGGEPGIGKSTLLLQAAAGVAGGWFGPLCQRRGVGGQVRLRATRLGLVDGPAGERVRVVAEIVDRPDRRPGPGERPSLLIVDSIQTATVDELDGAGRQRRPGPRIGPAPDGAGQGQRGRRCRRTGPGRSPWCSSATSPRTARWPARRRSSTWSTRCSALEGERYCGPAPAARDQEPVRLDRGGRRARDGRARPVARSADPARAFLAEHDGGAPGSVVAPTLEGSRPLLVEVQALTRSTAYGTPRRTASGIDQNRLALLVAVLGRRAGIGLGSHDVYANLAGGLSVDEPALDLPLALALASSFRDRPVRPGTVAIGEVGPARRAALGRRPRAPPARGGPPRLRAGDRAPVRPERLRCPVIDGLEVVAVATLREAARASAGLMIRGGRSRSGDARLTAHRGPHLAAVAIGRYPHLEGP